jgi:hypothetical protein
MEQYTFRDRNMAIAVSRRPVSKVSPLAGHQVRMRPNRAIWLKAIRACCPQDTAGRFVHHAAEPPTIYTPRLDKGEHRSTAASAQRPIRWCRPPGMDVILPAPHEQRRQRPLPDISNRVSVSPPHHYSRRRTAHVHSRRDEPHGGDRWPSCARTGAATGFR